MPNTPKWALPYPVPTDPADVPFDIQNLATALDGAVVGNNVSTTLPTDHKSGRLTYNSTTKHLTYDNGTNQVDVAPSAQPLAACDGYANGNSASQGGNTGQYAMRQGGQLSFCNIDTGTQSGTPNTVGPYALFYWDHTQHALNGRTPAWSIRTMVGMGFTGSITVEVGLYPVTNWTVVAGAPLIELKATPLLSNSHVLSTATLSTATSALISALTTDVQCAFGVKLSTGLASGQFLQLRAQLLVVYNS